MKMKPTRPANRPSRRLREILSRARKRIQRGEGIPHEKFWQEMDADAERQRPSRKS